MAVTAKPTTIRYSIATSAHWKLAVMRMPLTTMKVTRASQAVVETGVLRSEKAAALILANYTYHPIASLSIEMKLPMRIRRAVSAQGVAVHVDLPESGSWNLIADCGGATLRIEPSIVVVPPDREVPMVDVRVLKSPG